VCAADSQAGGSNQTSVAGAAAGGSQSNITSSNVASVVDAKASILQVDRPKSGYHGSGHHRQNVTADETYSRVRSPVSDRASSECAVSWFVHWNSYPTC
jgi:hypothetical protein